MARAGSEEAEERRRFQQALLIDGNLVMRDDRTRSWWQQLSGTAIAGPLEGRQLPRVPHALVSWLQWRTEHPATTVVLGEPGRDYRPVR